MNLRKNKKKKNQQEQTYIMLVFLLKNPLIISFFRCACLDQTRQILSTC